MANVVFSRIASAVVLATTFGCAHAPPQALTTQLARTDASIAQATQSGAPQGGLPELELAKDKRAKAQDALVHRKYDLSMQLAEQAQLDAQYAGIKSQADQAADSVIAVHRSNETLRNEAQRNTPTPPPR